MCTYTLGQGAAGKAGVGNAAARAPAAAAGASTLACCLCDPPPGRPRAPARGAASCRTLQTNRLSVSSKFTALLSRRARPIGCAGEVTLVALQLCCRQLLWSVAVLSADMTPVLLCQKLCDAECCRTSLALRSRLVEKDTVSRDVEGGSRLIGVAGQPCASDS